MLKPRLIGFLCVCCLGLAFSPASFAEDKKLAPSEQHAEETHPALREAVNAYLTAWSEGKYRKMQEMENWEGGEPLEGLHYMRVFNPDFGLSDWEISSVEPQGKDEFLVLITAHHNPPPQVTKLMGGEKKKVRSVLRQYWRKDGDQYTHLFHIEQQRLMQPMTRNQAKLPEKPATAPSDELSVHPE